MKEKREIKYIFLGFRDAKTGEFITPTKEDTDLIAKILCNAAMSKTNAG